MRNRLCTSRDSLMDTNDKVPPHLQLTFDAMSPEDQNRYLSCRFYMDKQPMHLEVVKSIRKAKQGKQGLDQELLAKLATYNSRVEDEKKWSCGRVGCTYKGTKQHILAHLR